MWNSGATGMEVKSAGYAPHVGPSEPGPIAFAADVAAVKQLVSELSRATPSSNTQTAQNLSDRLKGLREKVDGCTFKNDLTKLIHLLDDYIASQTAVLQSMQQLFSVKGDAPLPVPRRDGGHDRIFNRPVLRNPEVMGNGTLTEPLGQSDYYTDSSTPGRRPATGNEPGNIWSGFYQGPSKGNCVTISAIKAAMMRFGQKPTDVFNHVKVAGDGYNVEMRDGFRLHLSKSELAQAAYRADFKGDNSAMLADAHFLYAASAKRAQLENNDGYAKEGFEKALFSLNDGEDGNEGLLHLGLGNHIQETTVDRLMSGQLGVVTYGIRRDNEVFGHSLAVINGREEKWGKQGGHPPANADALALV